MCFLFVDRIVSTIPGKLIRGLKHVTWDDTYLCALQEGEMYFAPSLIGETLGQLAAWNVMAYHDFMLRPVAGIVANASLYRTVRPGETLFLESVIDELDDSFVRYHSTAKVGQDRVFVLEGAIGPLLPMTQFIDVDVVRRAYHDINRPGDWDKLVESPSFSSSALKKQISLSRAPNCSMQFDAIEEVELNMHWIAEKLVSRTAPYFPDHFPYNPVLPMTVLLECKLNLVHEFVSELVKRSGVSEHYKIRELRKIKMNHFVHPGDVVVCHLKLKHQTKEELILSCQSLVEGKRVCVVDIVMAVAEAQA